MGCTTPIFKEFVNESEFIKSKDITSIDKIYISGPSFSGN